MNIKNCKKEKILIGWSSKDITPPKPVSLMGQFHERISQNIRDQIAATALAIETIDSNGKSLEQGIIVSCDLACIEKEILDKLRKRVISEIAGFDISKLTLSATHIHTGPYTSDDQLSKYWGEIFRYHTDKKEIMQPSEYSDYLVECLCNAVVEAWDSRCEGGVSSGLGYAVVGHNRMVAYDDGSAVLYGTTNTINFDSLIGTSDHEVEILFFWDKQKDLTGIAINVACPSQVVELKEYISADFWGEVRKELKKRHFKDLYVLPLTGAAGDQSPRDLVRRGRGEVDMYDEPGLKEIAIRIANAVDNVIDTARCDIKTEMTFKHKVAGISLPLRIVSSAEAEKAANEYKILKKELGIDDNCKYVDDKLAYEDKFKLSILLGIIERYKKQNINPFYDIELHVIRLGDTAIATNPFELFLDYGIRIKARSKAQQTILVQLACGNGGYLPTERAVKSGGYSACVSNGLVGSEGGRLLVEHTINLINNMMED